MGKPKPKAYAQRCSMCRTRSPNGQPLRTQWPLHSTSTSAYAQKEETTLNALEAVVGVDDRGVEEGERRAEEGDEAQGVEEDKVVDGDKRAVAL